MGFEVVLQDERGEVIDQLADPQNYLHKLLPHPDDQSYQCLRFIDWYGDTTFNYLQIDLFLAELERLKSRAQLSQEKDLVQRIEGMARRCKRTRHSYLKFIGD
ncbi:MAG: hypothetical protein ACLQOO_23350 [Terriglobia bacterium]